MPRGRAQARHPRMFSCPIRVHSWFKHCLDYVFAYSCPFVSIRGSPSSPSFVFFRAFRGSNTAWTTFLHIRVHSCPFVVQASIWTTFVSIRVHSWFSLFPLLRVFLVYFVLFVVQTLLGLCFCPFVSIRGSPSSPSFVFFRAFRVFRGLILPFPFSLLF